MYIDEIMASPVKTIDKDQPVSTALDIMTKFSISALPVTEDKLLVGLITELDLVDRLGSVRSGKLTPTNIHVSSVMEWAPETVNPKTDIVDAAKLLVKRRERALIVKKGDEIAGILTNTHFVKQCQEINKLFVRDLTIEKPIIVHLTERVIHARNVLLAEGLPGLPVFDEGKVIGLVTKKRLAVGFAAFRRETPAKYQSTRLREFLVENIFTRTELTTHLDQSVGEAAKLLLREHQHLLPVMKDDAMHGILIRRSLVKLVANQFKP
ncbi:MAG: CBS domain-containing protein [Promethearchaeota archaeon]